MTSATVDPRQAQGAQIPLQSFTIPDFPPETGGLQSLTLTSDIKLEEYSDLLKDPVTVTKLIPPSIASLTLELFSLGYPPNFLSSLADRLPNIKSLVLYSQLFAGTTAETQQDAESFFEKSQNIRAIHFLDVFARPHFFERISTIFKEREKPVIFLEINYTFRHEDEDFLTRVPATELPMLIHPRLVSLALNVAEPETTDDPEDPSNLTSEGEEKKSKPEGIMAFNKSLATHVVDALTKEGSAPRTLRALNITMYTISQAQLRQIVEKHKMLMVLNVTVEVEPTEESKAQLLEILEGLEEVEQIEIVGNPSLKFYEEVCLPQLNIHNEYYGTTTHDG